MTANPILFVCVKLEGGPIVSVMTRSAGAFYKWFALALNRVGANCRALLFFKVAAASGARV